MDGTKLFENFNKLYPKKDSKGAEEPNTFTLQVMPTLKQISLKKLITLQDLAIGEPSAETLNNNNKKAAMFINQLYSLVPKDKESPDNMPLVLEFKPDMSYYCFKKLSVRHLNQDEYESVKPFEVYKNEVTNIQSLAVEYFNPLKIAERMNYKEKELKKKKRPQKKPTVIQNPRTKNSAANFSKESLCMAGYCRAGKLVFTRGRIFCT